MTPLVHTQPQMQTGPAILQPIIEIWVTFRMRGGNYSRLEVIAAVGGDIDWAGESSDTKDNH